VEIDGQAYVGFPTPSRKLEFFSRTLKDWKWPEEAVPGYIRSHVHWSNVDRAKGEMVLLPTFRLPTLIHTRGNSKWLYELSNSNPVWVNPEDARRIGVQIGDLVRITTDIGHFVNKVWVTEGMRPGVVACSHHLGRWRLSEDIPVHRWDSALVEKHEAAPGVVRFRRLRDIGPFESADHDSTRIWWSDGGVHQNLTFPVHPDPVSGMHCWHQAVKVERAREGDRYGDVEVDTNRSMAVYREWLALTRPAPGPGGLRRPLWLARAVRPTDEAYRIEPAGG
jgi:anaerobic selenocysteine-containing dehydrogenase